MILLNGGEHSRVIGFNFDKLHSVLDKAVELHLRDYNYFGQTGDTWERFYDNYDRFSRSGEYDRDSLRVVNES